MKNKKYDFSGYATKVGLKCSDGRTILQDAFQHNDGQTVPLVWQHLHNDPSNILGHAILENRKDGVYAYCSFNNSTSAKDAKEAIAHGDIQALSIYANSLVEKGKNVVHGAIREVSLVIAGANPEAYIDNIAFQHADGSVVADEAEAIICANEMLQHGVGDESSQEPPVVEHADTKTEEDDETLADVFDTLNEKQKTVVYAMLAHAIENQDEAAKKDGETKHSNIEGDNIMKKNIFDQSYAEEKMNVLSHDALQTILKDAQRCGSLKEAFLQHDADYGIENIDFLFPDAKTVTPTPAFIKRDTDWVKDVFNASHHSPFARIKSLAADITADDARAKGYVKGNQKVDEVIALLKRVTGPTTVYKKQKLDRDDIIDITDLDVVAWLKLEMRMMLEEEIARAQLVGDGRSAASDDKIDESNIRPIYSDDSLYSVKVEIEESATTSQTIDSMILARKDYKGSGNPTFFSTPDIIGDMLLLKDSTGRRLYNTINDLAAALRVNKIVEVPVMENVSRTDGDKTLDLLGIVVNMKDYYIGADKGGAVNMFDDFDIDYNQYKYLIETRCSGALVLPKSALVIEKVRTKPMG
ncbi:MAG: phage major capsid protein [Brevinema sp.]